MIKIVFAIIFVSCTAQIPVYSQPECSENLIKKIDSAAEHIDFAIKDVTPVIVKTGDGNEISAYYYQSELVMMEINKLSAENFRVIYFNSSMPVFFITKMKENETERFYFSDGELFCWILNGFDHKVNSDFYNREKTLIAEIEEYLLAVQ